MRIRIVAVVGLLVVSALGGTAASARDDGETLTVVFKDRQEHQVDADGPGRTPGDYYVFAQRLESRRGRTVGNVYGRCTYHFDGMELCEGVFKISGKGDISVQGAFPEDFSQPVVLAVNGGTGRYRTAHGEGRFTVFPNGDFGVEFHLVLDD
jgi:hypothetical protein